MRICLISFEEEGKRLYELLKNREMIPYVIERDNTQWGFINHETECISFSNAYVKYHKNEFEKFIIPCMRGINIKNAIYDRLIRNGVKSEDILYAPLSIFKNNEITEEEKYKIICRFDKRKELDYLALHITDHCNLNCENCSVLCGLIKAPSFPDMRITKTALEKLKGYFDQIQVIRVLGGEPTLNREWLDYCSFIRRLYPLSDIEVVTNGTRILAMKDEEFEVLKKESIAFDISYYPTIGEKIDKINQILKDKKIKFYISQENEFFSKLYSFRKKTDSEMNYKCCRMKFMCMNMRENYLGVCHASFGVERASRYLDFEGCNSISDFGRVDLFEPGLNAEIIMKMLDRPAEICAYCNKDLVTWNTIKSDFEDIKKWSI